MRGLAWKRHHRERCIRNRLKRFQEVFNPPQYGTPMWHWHRPPWWWWRRDYSERPLPPGRMDKARCPPTHANVSWERERKNWKLTGTRSNKVWRARKLGFEYPWKPLVDEPGWDEQMEAEPEVPGDHRRPGSSV